ncbi:MAG: hypothetical protein JWM63_3803 [Gammaproteobacteria bacterium]|jgi:uncharacterized protein (TIGR02117 family)|nr:hypothetical protein [Gammaproteobacteria bacterium]
MRLLLPTLLLILLCACSTAPERTSENGTTAPSANSTNVIYVVRRSWHIDIGFAAADLHPPLASVRAGFPGAQYLLFGFGDRAYLTKGGKFSGTLAALLPGPGLVLATGLEASPETVFGVDNVIRIAVSAAQSRDIEAFIWSSVSKQDGEASPLAEGAYGGSLYYPSTQRYSAFHTCNTWAAEALRAGNLPVHTFGVEFSGQLWKRVQHLARRAG